MQDKKKIGIKEVIRKIVFVVALIVFVFSAWELYNIWKEYNDNSKSYEKLRDYSPENTSDVNELDKYKFNPEDYEKLFAINPDLKCWITIPNTEINYPVVQTKDNSFYLNHNFEKQENDGGCIFIAYENKEPLEERNTIFHGHHMKDGSMFASLNKYKEPEFIEQNNKVFISTKYKVYEYEIFSVYVEKVSEDPYKYSFSSDEDYVNYLKALNQKSYTRIDTKDFTKDDKIITLSTCSYEVDDGRLIVHARLVAQE